MIIISFRACVCRLVMSPIADRVQPASRIRWGVLMVPKQHALKKMLTLLSVLARSVGDKALHGPARTCTGATKLAATKLAA
jgi:hypothetical protein